MLHGLAVPEPDAGNGGNVVVLALDLIEVVALAYPTGQLMADAGDEGLEIGCQLFDRIRAAAARDDVDLTVVIEED